VRIFQFAFDSTPEDPFLPHHYPLNCVVYTGTHDNDTVLGWYKRVPEKEKALYRTYMHRDGSDVSWDMIRGVWSSVAVFGLAPMQDFLKLGNEARMNYPGNPSGNWNWRMSQDALIPELQAQIKELNYLFSRSSSPI
jgi:4-alpha-glucanotransferase